MCVCDKKALPFARMHRSLYSRTALFFRDKKKTRAVACNAVAPSFLSPLFVCPRKKLEMPSKDEQCPLLRLRRLLSCSSKVVVCVRVCSFSFLAL